jgi:hypothetical protein
MSPSLCSILGVVPDEISAWKPDTAPHAIVMNRNGNSAPDHTGPVPSTKRVTAGMRSSGITSTMVTASSATVPIFMNVLR